MEKDEFGRRLSELRMQNGASARDMSFSVGKSHSYINRIENGVNYPSMDKFFFICEYLGITPQDFFDTGTPDPIKSKKVYQMISSLSSDQLDAVITMVKAMKK